LATAIRFIFAYKFAARKRAFSAADALGTGLAVLLNARCNFLPFETSRAAHIVRRLRCGVNIKVLWIFCG
jgi:hypothetical protein